jgi:hypothetical protein
MAITKANTSHLAAVTSTQTSTAQDISGSYLSEMFFSLTENGTRTTAATLKLQWSDDAGSTYYDGPTYSGPLTSTTTYFTVAIPTTANRVKAAFTIGSSGTSTTSTCTAQCGTVTAV